MIERHSKLKSEIKKQYILNYDRNVSYLVDVGVGFPHSAGHGTAEVLVDLAVDRLKKKKNLVKPSGLTAWGTCFLTRISLSGKQLHILGHFIIEYCITGLCALDTSTYHAHAQLNASPTQKHAQKSASLYHAIAQAQLKTYHFHQAQKNAPLSRRS